MNTTPVLSPLLALLRSRKVIVSIVVFLVALLINQFPFLAPIQGTLVSLLAVILVAVISGISIEDAAKYIGQRGFTPVTPTVELKDPTEELRQLIMDILDERANPTGSQ